MLELKKSADSGLKTTEISHFSQSIVEFKWTTCFLGMKNESMGFFFSFCHIPLAMKEVQRDQKWILPKKVSYPHFGPYEEKPISVFAPTSFTYNTKLCKRTLHIFPQFRLVIYDFFLG